MSKRETSLDRLRQCQRFGQTSPRRHPSGDRQDVWGTAAKRGGRASDQHLSQTRESPVASVAFGLSCKHYPGLADALALTLHPSLQEFTLALVGARCHQHGWPELFGLGRQ